MNICLKHRYNPRRGLLRIAVAVCLVACSLSAKSLDPRKTIEQYIYRHWGANEGYVGGAIYSIAQSSDGYLWIGTDRGLVRFDGRSFSLIQRPLPERPALGRVRELRLDSSGYLWIRSEGMHLLVYRDGSFHDAVTDFRVEESVFTAMTTDLEGRIILTGLGSTTIRYESGTFNTIANVQDVLGTITAIAATRNGKLWLGTRDGGLYSLADGHTAVGSSQLGNTKINSLQSAHNGGLWIGTDHGIQLLNTSGMLQPLAHGPAVENQILAMTDDKDANLWAGSNHGLIRLTRNEEQSISNRGNPTARIAAVFEDRDGTLWYGGENGLESLQDGVFTTYREDASLHPERNGALYADSKGRVWFAPQSGGLKVLENDRIHQITNTQIGRDIIYSIDGAGDELWLGRQSGGLTHLKVHGQRLEARTYTRADGLSQNSVYTVLRDQYGGVWAGTLNAGLSHLHNGAIENFNTENGLSSNTVNSIAEGKDGAIWAATPLGLNEFQHGRWRTWGPADGLPALDIRTCYADSSGYLWVETADGLAWIHQGHVEIPRIHSDLLREQILAMTEDQFGFMWFSTTDHLLRVSSKLLREGTLSNADVQTYGANEGLPEAYGLRRERSLAHDTVGNIWISIYGGVAAANSAPTYQDAFVAPVRINSLLSNGVEFPPHGSPKIPASSHDITIHFEAETLSHLESIRYRYKLDEVDMDWSQPIGIDEIRYSNLAPGTYHYHVMASRDGVLWNSPATTITFTIEHTLWQTWWFRLTLLATLTLIALAILRLRTLSLSRQMNARFQERLNERARIAQELHDTLLQGFQGLMLRFQTVNTLLPDRPADAKINLEIALNRADQALIESRDAIEGIRSDKGVDLISALNAMLVEAKGSYAAASKHPETSVIIEGTPRTIASQFYTDIVRIAHEAVRNSFQHSHATRIEIEVAYSKRQLRLCVRDDGVGIDPAILQHGSREGHWGLIGMKEKATRLKAQIDFWSKPGAGTEIELLLPATNIFIDDMPSSRAKTGRPK